MVKSQFTTHYDVVGQELRRLKSTPTPLLPSLKVINIHLLEHWQPSRRFENVSEPNTDVGTQNETCVFCVSSLFAHTRTNGTSSPVGRGEPEGISRSGLQVL